MSTQYFMRDFKELFGENFLDDDEIKLVIDEVISEHNTILFKDGSTLSFLEGYTGGDEDGPTAIECVIKLSIGGTDRLYHATGSYSSWDEKQTNPDYDNIQLISLERVEEKKMKRRIYSNGYSGQWEDDE